METVEKCYFTVHFIKVFILFILPPFYPSFQADLINCIYTPSLHIAFSQTRNSTLEPGYLLLVCTVEGERGDRHHHIAEM